MTKFKVLKDAKGEEIVINTDNITYFHQQLNIQTDFKSWTTIHFIGETNNPITFDISYDSLKKELGL